MRQKALHQNNPLQVSSSDYMSPVFPKGAHRKPFFISPVGSLDTNHMHGDHHTKVIINGHILVYELFVTILK